MLPQEKEKALHEAQRKLTWIRTRTRREWPVWPRPLLFTEVDYSTQLALGRSYDANEQLVAIDDAIRSIDPLPPTIEAIVNVTANLQRFRDRSYNQPLFVDLNKNCLIVDDAFQTILKNRQEIYSIKKEVRRKVGAAAHSVASSDKNIEFFKKLGTARYNDAIKNIEVAQESVDRAHVELANAVQADLVEWVAADLLCFTCLIALSIFRLKGRSYTLPETFEADQVLNWLSELANDLEESLDFSNLHDWNQLVLQKNQYMGMTREIAKVDVSLQEFVKLVKDFNHLNIQLTKINLRELSARTQRTQKQLESYIGAPVESAEWERILSRYKLPSVLLEEKRSQFTREIEPAIQGTVIKQSELPKIVRSADEFLQGVRKIQSLLRRIDEVTQVYANSEKEVKLLLDRNGEVERLARAIEGIAQDSAEDIRQDCQSLINEFQELSQAAQGDRKEAQFPALLQSILNFRDAGERVIARHEDAIKNLQDLANHYFRELNRFQNALMVYQYRKPVIEYVWAPVIERYNQILETYDRRDNHYSMITAFNTDAEAYLSEKKALLDGFEQQHKEFQKAMDGIKRGLSAAIRQIDRRMDELSRSWVNPLTGYLQKLNQHEHEYQRMTLQLQHIEDLSMDEAMETCRGIIHGLAEGMEQQAETIEEAIDLKLELDQLQYHIETLQANRTLTENNMRAVRDAYMYLLNAQNTYNPSEAKEYLNRAKLILEQAHLPAPNVDIRIDNPWNQASSQQNRPGSTQPGPRNGLSDGPKGRQ